MHINVSKRQWEGAVGRIPVLFTGRMKSCDFAFLRNTLLETTFQSKIGHIYFQYEHYQGVTSAVCDLVLQLSTSSMP